MPQPQFGQVGKAQQGASAPASPLVVTVTINAGDTGFLFVAFSGATPGSATSVTNGGTWRLRAALTNGTARLEFWATEVGAALAATTLSIAFNGTNDSVEGTALTYTAASGFGRISIASATSANPSVTRDTQDANSVVVAGYALADATNATVSPTAGTGNLRATDHIAAAGVNDGASAVTDNTASTPASVLNGVTYALATPHWVAIAVELRSSVDAFIVPTKGPPGAGPRDRLGFLKQRGWSYDLPLTSPFNNFPQAIDALSTFVVSITNLAGYQRTLAVAGTWTASLTRVAGFFRTLASAGTWTAGLARVAGYFRALASAGTWTAALSKVATHPITLAVTGTWTAALSKFTTHPVTLAVTSTFTVALTRVAGFFRALAVGSTFAAALNKLLFKLLAVASTFTPVLIFGRAYQRVLAVTSTMTAAISKTIGHLLSLGATSVFTAAISRRAFYNKALAVVGTFSSGLIRRITKTLGVVSAFSSALNAIASLFGQQTKSYTGVVHVAPLLTGSVRVAPLLTGTALAHPLLTGTPRATPLLTGTETVQPTLSGTVHITPLGH